MSNHYTYSVPFTAEELAEDYVAQKMTQAEVGRKWGVSQKVVWLALKKMGIETRKASPRNQRGAMNPNWKGGRHLAPASASYSPYMDAGYVSIYAPDHAHARKSGYAAEHIVVALAEKGIEKLPSGHCVHHIDLRKNNNDPSNLEICSHKEHQRFHSQLEELAAKMLLETGLIKFERGVGYVKTQSS